MSKKKILLVGEHPLLFTGNGNMMSAIINQIDSSKYDVSCFLLGDLDTQSFSPFTDIGVPWIPALSQADQDPTGKRKLLMTLERNPVDLVIFIGLDIFTYAPIFEHIKKIQTKNNFTWSVLAPYDAVFPREDHIKWFEYPDKVFIYSKYGHDELSKYIDNVEYFRPPLANADKFFQLSQKEKIAIRNDMFGFDTGEKTIFGFVGPNQVRKNIPKMFKAISMFLETGRTEALFYIHMNVKQGEYNIPQLVSDYSNMQGFTYYNLGGHKASVDEMSCIYNCLDYYMLFSHQEGLSWTPIEAMLCAVPCLLSDTTAHKDFKPNGSFVRQTDVEYLRQNTEFGVGHIETRGCSAEDISTCLCRAYDKNNTDFQGQKSKSVDFAKKWVSGQDSIERLLQTEVKKDTKSHLELI